MRVSPRPAGGAVSAGRNAGGFLRFPAGAGEGGDLRHFELAVQAQQEDFALVCGQVLQGGVEAGLVAGSGSAVVRGRRCGRGWACSCSS